MELKIFKKYKDSPITNCTDTVATERCFRLYFENVCQEEFYCLPSDFHALSIGYLVAQGIVQNAKNVFFLQETVTEDCDGFRLDVENIFEDEIVGLDVVKSDAKKDLFCQDTKEINWNRAMGYADELLHTSKMFEQTGCIHAAALCKDGRLCYFGEDISRFFAMYKTIGKAALAGEDLSTFVLCTTGRLPFPYIKRVIKSNIGCVVSRSAPTDLSYEYANKYGVAIFGFASGKRINYYRANIACCLLAGGKGSRAEGSDKAFFTYKGVSFLQSIFEKMCPDGEKIVSYNKDPQLIKDELLNCENLNILADITQDIGPIGGIYTALKASKSGAVLFAPCDLPFYSERISQLCKENFTGLEDAVVMIYGEKIQPLCGIYSKSCIKTIEKMIESKNYRIRDLLKLLNVTYIDAKAYGIEEECFNNINTLQEYNLL